MNSLRCAIFVSWHIQMTSIFSPAKSGHVPICLLRIFLPFPSAPCLRQFIRKYMPYFPFHCTDFFPLWITPFVEHQQCTWSHDKCFSHSLKSSQQPCEIDTITMIISMIKVIDLQKFWGAAGWESPSHVFWSSTLHPPHLPLSLGLFCSCSAKQDDRELISPMPF